METVADLIFLGSKISGDGVCSHEIERHLFLGRKTITILDSVLKSRGFASKGPYSQSNGFSSSHVWMWELDHKEVWTSKDWCFWTVVLEKTLESPLDSKEIKSVNPKGNQPWIITGRADAETEALILWPPGAKNQLIGKDPNDGKHRRQEKRGKTEEEMVGWHHQLNGHELEQVPGDGEGQGERLACCMGLQKVGHNWATVWQQQHQQFAYEVWSEVQLLSCVWLWHQAPPSMEFSRQEYSSGLPFPSPRDLPDPGLNPVLLQCKWTLYHLNHQGRSEY